MSVLCLALGVCANLTGVEEPECLTGLRVTASLLSVLGVAPEVGRLFTEEEAERGGRVVVMSHAPLDAPLRRGPSHPGAGLQLDGVSYKIAGVMPEHFLFPDRGVELWTPTVVKVERERGGRRRHRASRLCLQPVPNWVRRGMAFAA